jgi:hypothetical protein
MMWALMSLLNNPLALMITASLIIQIIVLFFLTYGYLLKRKSNFRQHGIIMTIAVILHQTMVFYIMIPSFLISIVPEYIASTPLEVISLVSLIHGILGIIALSLGIWLVAKWRFRQNVSSCFTRKNTMLKTLAIWIATLIFGITLYSFLIGPVLMS